MSRDYIIDRTFDNEDYTAIGFALGDYDNCKFLNCDFSNVDLSGITFTECIFDGCNLRRFPVCGQF
jgi:uncharacterized protein YjbI with pentapeptide repeats